MSFSLLRPASLPTPRTTAPPLQPPPGLSAAVEPTFSPMVLPAQRKTALPSLHTPTPSTTTTTSAASSQPASRRHSVDSSSQTAPLRPKYQCPACLVVFVKWSPCLSHLRDKHLDVYAHLLDKRQNGGDFRRAQEWCASQLRSNNPGGAGGGGGGGRADRTDSLDSLSSCDSAVAPVQWGDGDHVHLLHHLHLGGGHHHLNGHGVRPHSLPTPLFSSQLKLESTHRTAPRLLLGRHLLPRMQQQRTTTSMQLLKRMDDRMIFRIFSYLDVDSAQFFYLAMEEETSSKHPASPLLSPSQPPPPQPLSSSMLSNPTMSRVRIWSNASNSSSDTRL